MEISPLPSVKPEPPEIPFRTFANVIIDGKLLHKQILVKSVHCGFLPKQVKYDNF